MSEDNNDAPDTLPSFSAPLLSRTEEEIPREVIRRSENVQILIGLAVMTLAGTLFVQGKISFPFLESIADTSVVKWSFRIFVYLTAVFLVMKLITSTFYPGSENKKLILIHEWVEPFVYVGASMLLVLVIVVTIIGQNIPPQFRTILITVISIIGLVSIGYFAYSFANRTSAAYEETRELEIKKLKVQIIQSLIRRNAWEQPIPEDLLLQLLPAKDISRAKEALRELVNNPEVPINETTDGIIIERDSMGDLAHILRNWGYQRETLLPPRRFTGFDDE